MDLPYLVTPSYMAAWVWLQLPVSILPGSPKYSEPPSPPNVPYWLELKCHKPFQNTSHWKHLSSRLPPPNNFWPFLPNLEAHFNAEILFQGRRILSVIWRTEDPLPPTPQPAVKSRGHKKLHQTVTCVSLQEQWQNKLLFCLVLFPIYKTFLGPRPQAAGIFINVNVGWPPPSPSDSKINWQLQTKPCVSEGTPEKSTSPGRLPGLGKSAPPPPPSQQGIFHFK